MTLKKKKKKLKPDMVVQTCNPGDRRKKKDQMFKASLGYIVIFVADWTTRYPVSENKQQNQPY